MPPSCCPRCVAAVEERLKRRPAARRSARRARERLAARHAALRAEWQATVSLERATRAHWRPPSLAAEVWDVIKDEDWVLANGTAKGWARRLWDWQPERSYGGSGGAGLGYGLPAALGVTLAHRGSGKVCVNLQSRRRPALRRQRPLHRRASPPAAAHRHVQQPHLRQRRGAPGDGRQDARPSRREQGGRASASTIPRRTSRASRRASACTRRGPSTRPTPSARLSAGRYAS